MPARPVADAYERELPEEPDSNRTDIGQRRFAVATHSATYTTASHWPQNNRTGTALAKSDWHRSC